MTSSPVSAASRLLACASIAALLLSGCSNSTDSASTSTTAKESNAASGGSGAGASSTAKSDGDGSTTTAKASSGSSTNGPVPGAEWDRVDAKAAGFDPAKLQALADTAKSGESNCIAVVKDGKLVTDQYWNGAAADKPQEVFSATKSYTSALVGIAADEGLVKIDDPAYKYIPEWEKTEAKAVTVRDLLSNDSGRHYDNATDYGAMAVAATDKTQFAIDLGQDAPPDTVWRYNNSAIQTLSQVIEKATKTDGVSFAKDKLLGPIGMDHSTMTKDPSGNMKTFMGLQSTCLDMARFGLLMLNDGNWGGTQIVSADWVKESTSPSQVLNPQYGFLWWLNTEAAGANTADQATGGPSSSTAPPKSTKMVPSAPDDTFFALGLGNQIIAVVPEENLVAVRLGPVNKTANATAFNQATLVEGALAALDK